MMTDIKDCGFYGRATVDVLLLENVVVLVAVHFSAITKMVNVFSNHLEMIFKMALILQLLGTLNNYEKFYCIIYF